MTAISAEQIEELERFRSLLTAVALPLHWQKSHLSGKTVDLKREHWVLGSATTLRGLGLIFGDDSRLARLIVEAINALPQMLDELEESRQLFEAQWDANQRGIKAWQEANPGNDLVWPDQAKLVEWLLAEVKQARAELAEANEAICKAATSPAVHEAPRDVSVPLRVRGVGRVADEPRALLLALNERPTDDEIRALHDHLSGAVIAP